MKLREVGTWIIVGMAALIAYSEYTAQDVKELRNKAHKEYTVFKGYALDYKDDYLEKKKECKTEDGWKDNKLCNFIEENDEKAKELWKELKILDEKLKIYDDDAAKIQRALETIEKLKEIAVPIVERLEGS